MKTPPLVSFYFNDVQITLKDRNQLKAFIPTIFDQHSHTLGQLSYVFCSDAYLLELNKAYLQHQTFTDILTFDLSESEQAVIAEIYISVDRVRENAKKFQTSIKKELHRVIFHGILHLLGFNDHSEKEKKEMRARENELLNLYFMEQ